MKKLFYLVILIFAISNLVAQESDKLFVEIIGEFNPITGTIEKIEMDGENTKLFINVKNKTTYIVFRNSILNKPFLSYVNIGDMLNLKVNDNEKKIAIFKKQSESVKVKIFFIKD